jgi:hypothetical protein
MLLVLLLGGEEDLSKFRNSVKKCRTVPPVYDTPHLLMMQGLENPWHLKHAPNLSPRAITPSEISDSAYIKLEIPQIY